MRPCAESEEPARREALSSARAGGQYEDLAAAYLRRLGRFVRVGHRVLVLDVIVVAKVEAVDLEAWERWELLLLVFVLLHPFEHP